MTDIQIYISSAAGVLELLVYVLIIRSMRKGVTKPNLAGWVLYTVAMGMVAASSIALGAWQVLFLVSAYLIGQVTIIGLSFKTGYFAFSKFDYASITLSLLGLLLSIQTTDPLYALVLNVGVDALGTLAIARKVYLHQETEDRVAWTLASGVAILNLFAVTSFDVSNALFPIYIVFANVLIAVLSFRRIENAGALANEAMDRGV